MAAVLAFKQRRRPNDIVPQVGEIYCLAGLRTLLVIKTTDKDVDFLDLEREGPDDDGFFVVTRRCQHQIKTLSVVNRAFHAGTLSYVGWFQDFLRCRHCREAGRTGELRLSEAVFDAVPHVYLGCAGCRHERQLC